jgi:hypothetical protein
MSIIQLLEVKGIPVIEVEAVRLVDVEAVPVIEVEAVPVELVLVLPVAEPMERLVEAFDDEFFTGEGSEESDQEAVGEMIAEADVGTEVGFDAVGHSVAKHAIGDEKAAADESTARSQEFESKPKMAPKMISFLPFFEALMLFWIFWVVYKLTSSFAHNFPTHHRKLNPE